MLLTRYTCTAAFCFILAGCATRRTLPPSVATPTPAANVPVRPVTLERVPDGGIIFSDDADTASLRTAALQSSIYLHSLPPQTPFLLAADTYTAAELAAGTDELADLLEQSKAPGDWLAVVQRDFIAYQSVGAEPNHTVTFSSYYEPSIPGRLTRDAVYKYPLYGRPPDLIDVNLGLFDPALAGRRISGRRDGRLLVPYYSRKDIDSNHGLAGQGLEIAWAKDPLDIFFLQVEGSGWLEPGAGGTPVRIRYDGDNGLPFRSVGQYMINTHRVKGRTLSHNQLIQYMVKHPKQRQDILNVDPRYIFFRVDTSTASAFAYGNINVPLTGGRSIATDPRCFPRGLLAWVDIEGIKTKGKPAKRIARFMLNQDEGGAILGPGRVDFFAGHGPEAEQFATHFWNPGKLYFLVKKPTAGVRR